MMTMKKPPRLPSTELRILSTSDIHLYHSRVPTEHIIACIDAIIAEDGHGDGIDILSIVGDLFDREVPFGSEEVTPISACLIRLLRYCERHDVLLVVLYGTPSHDRKQSRRFQDWIDELNIDVEFIYADKLSIEYIPKFGINVLFVPDEWRTDVAVTLSEVKELMAQRGLDKVDFAFMHGCFPHQLPPIDAVQAKAHSSQAYLELVRHQIFIGHHHTFSVFDRIVSHGSLTRLAQGEEGPKGYVVYDLMDDKTYKLTFVENEEAWSFKAIQASSLTYSELLETIRAMNLRPGSYVSVIAGAEDECSRLFKRLTKEVHGINLDLNRPKSKKQQAEREAALAPAASTPQIHAHNIGSVVEDWLARKGVNQSLIQQCTEALKHEQSLTSQ